MKAIVSLKMVSSSMIIAAAEPATEIPPLCYLAPLFKFREMMWIIGRAAMVGKCFLPPLTQPSVMVGSCSLPGGGGGGGGGLHGW